MSKKKEEFILTGFFFIPALGTKITLAEPWTFDVYNEYRNQKLLEWQGYEFRGIGARNQEYGAKLEKCTFPAGTVLTVVRIYVRNGLKDYDSVTFYARNYEPKTKKAIRFWAKLRDVNRIKFDNIESPKKED